MKKPESPWFEDLEKMILERTGEMNNREMRYFQVKRLLNMARKADIFYPDCEVCRKFRDELPELGSKLPEYFDGPPADRIRYERAGDEMLRHFRNHHRVYVKRYFTAMYSVLGMLAGIGGGILFAYAYAFVAGGVPEHLYRNGLLLGWLAGLVAGQLTGSRKDRIVEKDGRQI